LNFRQPKGCLFSFYTGKCYIAGLIPLKCERQPHADYSARSYRRSYSKENQ